MAAIYWQLMEPTSASRLTQIETDAGKRPSVSNYSANWYSGTYPNGSYVRAQAGSSIATNLTSIRNNGQIPWLDWYSTNSVAGSDTNFVLKQIYQVGLHDTFLRQWAGDIAALGFPIFVRFDGEMNGSWRPTYYERNGLGPAGLQNAAGDFKLMWQHVYNIVAPIAPNITWVWCPNCQPPSPTITYASIFPGSAYVNWLALDTYNWAGSQPGGGKTSPWMTFSQIMTGFTGWLGNSWAELTALDPNMPCCIGEHGCDPREGTDTNPNANTTAVWNGQKKADWFTDELNVQLPGNGTTDFRRLRMISYFNVTEDGQFPPVTNGFATTNGDMPIEDPTAVSGKPGGGAPQAAWQAQTGINSTYYVRGGQFVLPSGLNKVYPYEGTPQVSRFDNGVFHTAQGKLQAMWRLNEGSGSVATDGTGNAHTGTYTGGITLGQQRIAQGVYTQDTSVLFNGTTGYVSVPNSAQFWIPNTGKLTVFGIFQPVTLPASGTATIVSCGGDGNGFGWEVRIGSAGSIQVTQRNLAGATYSDALTANGLIGAGTTYFFCWSQDTTLAGSPSGSPFGHLYYGPLGGTLVTNKTTVDTTTLSPLPTVGTGTLNIGRRGDNTLYFNGYIQRIGIYSDAVSAVSASELFLDSNWRRDRPRNYVV